MLSLDAKVLEVLMLHKRENVLYYPKHFLCFTREGKKHFGK